ncbi:MAG: dTDP-glucose 4,6-dehydratase [Helicobacteraceae bacterium]|nr:dTDP-glucose 4,6-dehydratase [Helicobacteraceae bacterium]
MQKKFDNWNILKQNINDKKRSVHFRQGEIYFINIGQNIGYEVFGKQEEFLRPVLIFRKINNSTFLAIPLTSKVKNDNFHHTITFKDRVNSAMITQIKTFDSKRLLYKIGKIDKETFTDLEEKIVEFYKLTPKRGGYTLQEEEQRISNIISKKTKFVNSGLKTLLLTGCAGFIGSNFVPYFLQKYENYNIINLDLLTYAGEEANLSEVENSERYKFIKGDICNRELVEFIFNEYDIRGVIHFAAESHVDNSIKNPGIFIETNVTGTYTLVDVAKNYWMSRPFNYKTEYEGCRFHHISTDEVYGTLGDTGLFTETTPYAPNSPYSASKASSDMIIRSYNETYGLNTVITNCSNNYGAKQHDEKLIPTIIRKALANEPIPIYGDGKNIRDWLYVLDHCKGIDLVFHDGLTSNTYNIGGRNERDNLYIVNKICEILDQKVPQDSSYKSLITFVEDRAGHDRRYAIDATKIENELGWKAEENFESGILKTIEWYLKKYEEIE